MKDLLVRWALNQERVVPEIPISASLEITMSKATYRSTRIWTDERLEALAVLRVSTSPGESSLSSV